MEFRDLKTQYHALGDKMNEAILDVCSSGRYIGGPQVDELERVLAEYVGLKHCITCANGTDALQLALLAWGVGPSDAVFIPDFTFFSTGEVVSSVGANPVFVDVCERTFNLDAQSLWNAIEYVKANTDLTPRAVIAVDLFGLPADYPSIRRICDEEGLLLLEDGAQGFGGSILGHMACSFGDISTTSFFPAKPLGCYGDGGACFTDNDEWATLMRSYAVHGKGAMKYDNVRIGMNSRLDTIQAAILLVKFQSFKEREIEAVNTFANDYSELLNSASDRLGFELPEIPDGYVSSWAQYTLKMADGQQRDQIKDYLSGCDIPTMVYYPKPMHDQLAFIDKSILPPDGCPVTSSLCRRVLSLPMGPYLGSDNLQRVSNAFAAL